MINIFHLLYTLLFHISLNNFIALFLRFKIVIFISKSEIYRIHVCTYYVGAIATYILRSRLTPV